MRARRAAALLAVAALLACALAPASAQAHGISGSADLPIPQWMFAWAAAIVLIASFLALGVLWPRPRLQHPRLRRVLTIPPGVRTLCGLIGVAAYGAVVWSAFAGTSVPTANLAPGHEEFRASASQGEIQRAAQRGAVHSSSLPAAVRAHRAAARVGREGDLAVHHALRAGRELLRHRDDSREGEVRRYTEGGHRVLRVRVRMGLQTSSFCSTRRPVSNSFPATQPANRLPPNPR